MLDTRPFLAQPLGEVLPLGFAKFTDSTANTSPPSRAVSMAAPLCPFQLLASIVTSLLLSLSIASIFLSFLHRNIGPEFSYGRRIYATCPARSCLASLLRRVVHLVRIDQFTRPLIARLDGQAAAIHSSIASFDHLTNAQD